MRLECVKNTLALSAESLFFNACGIAKHEKSCKKTAPHTQAAVAASKGRKRTLEEDDNDDDEECGLNEEEDNLNDDENEIL